MSSFDMLGLGIQALRANQTALNTVGQNISNVNTPGYSRQIVNFQTLEDQSGVRIEDIDRVTDRFLTRQLWSDLSAYNRSDVYATKAAELDNLLASSDTSVSAALDEYFKALQNAVDDPTSLPNRELFIAQSDALVRRFNELDDSIRRQNDAINTQMNALANQATTLAKNIADLNNKIRVATGSGSPANELRDQREELTNQLAEIVDIHVVEQDNDEFSIFIGNGQPLVVGLSSNTLVAVPGDPDRSQNEIGLVIAGNKVNVTDELKGGQVGGMVEYRDDILNNALDELGRIAIVFSETMNNQHQSGLDLRGEFGGLLFGDINDGYKQNNRISANPNNATRMNTARVAITDTAKLQASEYELVFNSPTEITLVRESDNKRFTLNNLTQVTTSALDVEQGQYYADFSAGELTLAVDGMTISLDGLTKFTTGDRFLIQPVRLGADDMSLVIKDGHQLALASPVRVTTDSDNQGTGVATATVTNPNAPAFGVDGQLNPPLEVVFNNTAPLSYTVFDTSNPLNPVPLDLGAGPLVNQPYTAGEVISVDGFDIKIINQPLAGDRFSFTFNSGGISDNRNALGLSNLQQADTLLGGAYQDIYGSLVERVGSSTATARISVDANKAVLSTTVNAKASVSGVNMDEEAAKLVQYQQAYQASARLIQTSQTLFDTLLNSF